MKFSYGILVTRKILTCKVLSTELRVYYLVPDVYTIRAMELPSLIYRRFRGDAISVGYKYRHGHLVIPATLQF